MATVNLACDDPLHASRSALPGWAAVLGTGSVAVPGLRCQACADANAAVRAVQAANGDTLRATAAGLIAALESADGSWPTLTPLQKDAAARQALRGVAKLVRLLLGRLESA